MVGEAVRVRDHSTSLIFPDPSERLDVEIAKTDRALRQMLNQA